MERDLNLYRDILLLIEKCGTPWDHGSLQVDRRDGFDLRGIEDDKIPPSIQDTRPEVLTRHVQLMIQAGLLEGKFVSDEEGIPPLASIHGVTHEGFEFLDNVRDESVWRKTIAVAGQSSLDVTKAVASGLMKSTVGL